MNLRSGFRLSFTALLAGAVLGGAVGCTQLHGGLGNSFGGRTWVDLTHSFDADTVYWPTEHEGFVLDIVHDGPSEEGYHYAAARFSTAEHGGTHLDAPRHFAAGKLGVAALPLASLIGPAVVIDIAQRAANDPDALLEVADLRRWEARHGRIPVGAIVLMRSGWSRHWPDRARVLGTSEFGDVDGLHFPGIAPGAARFLVEQREIAAVGVDTPSIDHGPSRDFATHRIVAAADMPAFENVAHLESLPETGALVVALPMKIRGGTGAPLRIVGVLPVEMAD